VVDIESYHTAYITLVRLIESTSALNVTEPSVTSVHLCNDKLNAAPVLINP